MSEAKTSRVHQDAISGLGVWRNRPIRYLVLCGLTLIAAIVAGTAIMAVNLRDRALFENERELKNTALILAEQIDRVLLGIDLVQSGVIEKIQALGIASSEDFARRMSGEDVHLMLKTSVSGSAQAYAMSLINADGHLINFSLSWPVPSIDVADREFFNALKSDPRLTAIAPTARGRCSSAARSWQRMASSWVLCWDPSNYPILISFSAPFHLAKAARSPCFAVTAPC